MSYQNFKFVSSRVVQRVTIHTLLPYLDISIRNACTSRLFSHYLYFFLVLSFSLCVSHNSLSLLSTLNLQFTPFEGYSISVPHIYVNFTTHGKANLNETHEILLRFEVSSISCTFSFPLTL